MKILILGGNRFMGYFLALRLINERHRVSVLNRGSHRGIFGGRAEEIICDRNDVQEIEKNLKSREFDVVYDFSAYDQEQVKKIVGILKGRIKQYIFTSSVAVYDQKQQLPYKESSRRGGRNPFGEYAQGKSRCEDFLCKEKDFPSTILRPTYVYGPRDYTDRMNRLFIQIMRNETVRMHESNPKAQFVYVHDTVNAFHACLQNKKAIGQAYNVCGDEIITYGELVEMIGEIAGKKPKASFTLTADFPYEDWIMYCDNSKSKKDLNMKYTTLRDGLKETWNWLNEHSLQV